MTITVTMWRDEGAVVSGRGTPRAVTNFNMKDSSAYATAYYPTTETASAPLGRTLVPGEQVLSYKVYTYFKIEGTYNIIKNPKIIVSVKTPAEADKTQLFYKLTNTYEVPDKAYDGSMNLLADGNSIIVPVMFPNMSSSGPHLATSRALSYSNVSPLYTCYIVTQVRVNANSLVGNTPEFKMRFECKEYGVF